MTYAKGYKVLLSDVIAQFNAQVRNVIYNKIQWYKSNYPSSMTSEYTCLFKNKDLPTMTASSSGSLRVGQIIVWADFFAKAQALFLTYVHVRHIDFKRYKWANTNGGSKYVEKTPYKHENGWGIITDDDPSILNKFDNIDYKGKLLKTENINSMFSTLVSTWSNLGVIQWNHTDPCHTNCHSSCHGSGGYR